MGFSSPQWQLFEFCDEMPVLVRGSSMLPWLRSGDLIHLDTRRDPSIGDIVLRRCDDCPPLLHRVVDQRDDRWLTRGDNVPGDDGWCLRGQIVGVAIAGERRGRTLYLPSRWLARRVAPLFHPLYQYTRFLWRQAKRLVGR